MVAEHGVDAVAGKHVHHKNGIRWDNRPEKLQPTVSGQRSAAPFGDADEFEPGVHAGPERDEVGGGDRHRDRRLGAVDAHARPVAVDVAGLDAGAPNDASGPLGVGVVEFENGLVVVAGVAFGSHWYGSGGGPVGSHGRAGAVVTRRRRS